MRKVKVVAHRGFAEKYPENSKSAFLAAINCGCKFLELDVQLTKDLVPVVIHDTRLKRTGDLEKNILQTTWAEIKDCSIGEPKRFAKQFIDEKILSLENFVDFIKHYPDVGVFVEIKEESILEHGKDQVTAVLESVLQPIIKQVILISFNAEILFSWKERNLSKIGFVLRDFNSMQKKVAAKLNPEILICNYKKIADIDNVLWEGKWAWFLYEIKTMALAEKWIKRGVEYIETMNVKSMIESLQLHRP